GIGALDGHDHGVLVDIQLVSNARQDFLTIAGGGGKDVAVALAQLGNQRSDPFRQLVGECSVIGIHYLAHASDFGGGFGSGTGIVTGDQHVNVATDLLSGGNGVQSGSGQSGVSVFSNNQDSHLDYLRLVLQFLYQFRHGLDLDAGAAGS